MSTLGPLEGCLCLPKAKAAGLGWPGGREALRGGHSETVMEAEVGVHVVAAGL